MILRAAPRRPGAGISPPPDAAKRSSGLALVAFVVLAYALSWMWAIPLAAHHLVVVRGQAWPTHYPTLFGPAVAAIVVVAATIGRWGVAGLLHRTLRWRVGWRWWLVAVSPVAVTAIALLGSWLAGRNQIRLKDFGLFSGVPAVGVLGVVLLVVVGALGEELGWRGFALPQLQHRFGPLMATLILAAVWALWHLPLFFVIATYRSLRPVDYAGFVIGLSCGAIVLTWLYNRSGGSILLVTVWHGAYNVVIGTQAGTGLVAAVVSTLVMAQALLLAGLHLRARRRGHPSLLAVAGATTGRPAQGEC